MHVIKKGKKYINEGEKIRGKFKKDTKVQIYSALLECRSMKF